MTQWSHTLDDAYWDKVDKEETDKLAAQTFARARLDESQWKRVSDVTPHQLAAMTLQHPLAGAEGSEGEWDDPRDFRAALAGAERVGFVFGSESGRGHGVYATGPARFTLLDFRVE